jgi:hypothetical protein
MPRLHEGYMKYHLNIEASGSMLTRPLVEPQAFILKFKKS